MSMMAPPIILLKDGTENKQGKQQIISNINACSVSAFLSQIGPVYCDICGFRHFVPEASVC